MTTERVLDPFVRRISESDFKKNLTNLQSPAAFLISFSSTVRSVLEEMDIRYADHLEDMAWELIRTRNPALAVRNDPKAKGALKEMTSDYLSSAKSEVIVYPYRSLSIRILCEPDFRELRTNRNRGRISREEQNLLSTARIGIVGMSVGRSAISTLALEGVGGEYRIADGDRLELSNLNRIKSGLPDLGEYKTVSAAKEIAELNPFARLICYNTYLTEKILDDFLLRDGSRLDILIDECDDIAMKFLLRIKAKKYGIPVVMETSDRGMLDIERFDLEPERAIFHGKVDEQIDFESFSEDAVKMKQLINIVDISNVSRDGRESLTKIGKELLSWPQLASAVTLGGALVAHASRLIILNKMKGSGRFYVDLEQLIK